MARQGPREGKGSEVLHPSISGASIPSNWASFRRVDNNKTKLFSFLSGALLDSLQLADKQLEGLHEEVQVQEGKPGMYTTM